MIVQPRCRTWLDNPKTDFLMTRLNYLFLAPQFVGSFNIDDAVKGGQVFFFFREIAEEYTESRTKIFSRVAKVCKVSGQCLLP